MKTSALYGIDLFPVVIAKAEGTKPAMWIEPKLFYPFIFSPLAEEYVPLGAFATRGEAECALAHYREICNTPDMSGAVVEMFWHDFCAKAWKTGSFSETGKKIF